VVPILSECSVTLDTAGTLNRERLTGGCKQTVRWVADECKPGGISWFLWDRRVIESGNWGVHLEFQDRTEPCQLNQGIIYHQALRYQDAVEESAIRTLINQLPRAGVISRTDLPKFQMMGNQGISQNDMIIRERPIRITGSLSKRHCCSGVFLEM